ncbi:MAG: hypothetical protein COB30_003160 [Ectothiorhodospiraceae bacterium]|nr:hypothetical protein [Ectothiorhodospiraceae bacterium]
MENNDKQFLIFESDSGAIEVQLEGDTLWLSQREISLVFGTEVPAISKHVSNILTEEELDAEATVFQNGKRSIRVAGVGYPGYGLTCFPSSKG